jgi:hypothetical protein
LFWFCRACFRKPFFFFKKKRKMSVDEIDVLQGSMEETLLTRNPDYYRGLFHVLEQRFDIQNVMPSARPAAAAAAGGAEAAAKDAMVCFVLAVHLLSHRSHGTDVSQTVEKWVSTRDRHPNAVRLVLSCFRSKQLSHVLGDLKKDGFAEWNPPAAPPPAPPPPPAPAPAPVVVDVATVISSPPPAKTVPAAAAAAARVRIRDPAESKTLAPPTPASASVATTHIIGTNTTVLDINPIAIAASAVQRGVDQPKSPSSAPRPRRVTIDAGRRGKEEEEGGGGGGAEDDPEAQETITERDEEEGQKPPLESVVQSWNGVWSSTFCCIV